MKKVQFKRFIKTIMFLSLLVSVISIQHVSAQFNPPTQTVYGVKWCVVLEGENEKPNCENYISFKRNENGDDMADLHFVGLDNEDKATPEIKASSLFILRFQWTDRYGDPRQSNYYLSLDPEKVLFADCNRNVYKIVSVNEMFFDGKRIEVNKDKKQEFKLAYNDQIEFKAIVTIRKVENIPSEVSKNIPENLPDCPVKPTPVPTPEPTPQSFDVEYIPRNIIVHFHKENGFPDSIAFVDLGGKLLPTQLPKVEKEGYEFLGWYYKASDEYKLGPRGLDDELLPFDLNRSIYADINLYAKWKQKVVVVPEQPKKAVPNTADC